MDQTALQKRFADFYNAHSDAVFRFCYIRVSDREQALDLTQEAFTRLWQTLNSGRTIDNERGFIFTIAHNLIVDWYRKKKAVSLDAMASEETGEAYEPVEETVRADIEWGAEGRFLVDAIRKLEPSYQQVLYLRFIEGLLPAEIGKILGISANTASVRVSRGIKELRKLTGYEIDGSETHNH